MTKTEFNLDKALIERKATLFTNCQMGFVGVALMLMMMDLSKIYLLAPLGAGLILVSWYKSQMTSTFEEFKYSSIAIAPKSLLFKKPSSDLEQRITFRELEEVTLHQQHFLPVVTLYLKDDSEKVELYALENAAEFVDELNGIILNLDSA